MEFKVNQFIYIQIEEHDMQQAENVYRARIADCGMDHFMIEIPMHEKTGQLKSLKLNEYISAHSISEEGIKSFFTTVVLGHSEESIRLIKLKRPNDSKIIKVQRRNYLRVPTGLDLVVETDEGERIKTKIRDINSGGLSFIYNGKPLMTFKQKVSCSYLLRFRNGLQHRILCSGDIIRIQKVNDIKMLIVLAFEDLNVVDRQKIMKYCFERQLELRK